ncbi:hypothetical protein NC315_24980 [Streptomyces sp. G2]|uniref:hypothetical protein n=1 Tax=Streptomyces TaxID=1883 RepID=UPI00202EE882|nr:hypothetical protein [Streptomyces sp. G2]MCM1948602.1 hypothetical protein [Streptomyces sp. G2]
MKLGVEWYGGEVTMASRAVASPWLVLPLCALLVLLGLALVTNFRGVPERLHERQRGRQQGFLASYDFQRFLGAVFVLVGGWGLVATAW